MRRHEDPPARAQAAGLRRDERGQPAGSLLPRVQVEEGDEVEGSGSREGLSGSDDPGGAVLSADEARALEVAFDRGRGDVNADDLFTKIQAVLDHVSAMTDVYALDLFRKLNGMSLPAV